MGVVARAASQVDNRESIRVSPPRRADTSMGSRFRSSNCPFNPIDEGT
jgi:hypothetical protein